MSGFSRAELHVEDMHERRRNQASFGPETSRNVLYLLRKTTRMSYIYLESHKSQSHKEWMSAFASVDVWKSDQTGSTAKQSHFQDIHHWSEQKQINKLFNKKSETIKIQTIQNKSNKILGEEISCVFLPITFATLVCVTGTSITAAHRKKITSKIYFQLKWNSREKLLSHTGHEPTDTN